MDREDAPNLRPADGPADPAPKRRRPCTVKKISGHQHTIRSIGDYGQQTCIVLVIQRQEFGISRACHQRGVKKQVIGTQSQDFLDGIS
jgi:hypothetical protein